MPTTDLLKIFKVRFSKKNIMVDGDLEDFNETQTNDEFTRKVIPKKKSIVQTYYIGADGAMTQTPTERMGNLARKNRPEILAKLKNLLVGMIFD